METAGILVVRQSPPTTKGHVFLTLEDEHSLIDVILRPRIAERYRALLGTRAALRVVGMLQREGEVTSVLIVLERLYVRAFGNVQTACTGSCMTKLPLRTRPLDTFLSDWTWDRFLAAWKAQVGPLPDLRQHIVPLYAPRFSFSTWCWWPRGEEEARLRALQHYVLTHPNGDPLLWFPTMRSGERDTAAYLSAAADSDTVAATLICATLHPYIGYARHVNLLDWPDLPVCRQLYDWSREAATLPHRAWHHLSSSVLPELPHHDEYGAARLRAFYQPDGLTGESMVADMARYHRVLLNTWRIVTLVVDDVGDVDLVQQLRTAIAEEHAERSRRQQAWRAEQAAKEAERVCQAEAFQRRHPRAREWPPQAELLRELVWSMPTTAVAELFGVSDVAVAKLCLKRGVAKPPRGFWRKVEAGLLPHPQGRPAHT